MEAYQRGVSEGPTTMTTSLEVQNIFGVASGCAEYCDAHTVVRSPRAIPNTAHPHHAPVRPSLFWVRGLTTVLTARPHPPILPSRSPGHPGGQRPEALRRQRAHRPLPRGRGNRDLVLRDEPRERRDARVRHQGTRRRPAVHVHALADLTALGSLEERGASVGISALAFSRDGKLLALASTAPSVASASGDPTPWTRRWRRRRSTRTRWGSRSTRSTRTICS